MNKRAVLTSVLSVILVLVLMCGSTSAEMRRGSKGEDVREMQQMMIDLGVLDGYADGKFGPKTEAAVKKLQLYWGKKQDGRVSDAFMNDLNDLWHLATGNGTESGADPDEDLENPVRTCAHNENAPYGYDYCYRHDEGKMLRDLLRPVKGRKIPDGLKKAVLRRIREYWLEQIRLAYDEWEENAGDDEANTVAEQRELFEQGWAEAEPDMIEAGGGVGSLKTLEAWADWLETAGTELCFDLHGAETNP